MHITYSSIGVRDLCECGLVCIKKLGSENARLLQQVIADLQAAGSISELPPLYRLTLQESSLVIEAEEGLKIMGIVRTLTSSTSKQALKIEAVTCGE